MFLELGKLSWERRSANVPREQKGEGGERGRVQLSAAGSCIEAGTEAWTEADALGGGAPRSGHHSAGSVVGEAIEGRRVLAGQGHQSHQGCAHQNILVTAATTAELQPNHGHRDSDC